MFMRPAISAIIVGLVSAPFLSQGSADAGCYNQMVNNTLLPQGAGVDKVTTLRSRAEAAAVRLFISATGYENIGYSEDIMTDEHQNLKDAALTFSPEQQVFKNGIPGKQILVSAIVYNSTFTALWLREDLDTNKPGQRIFYSYEKCSDQYANTTVWVNYTQH
jgi:hypothetical protein